MGVEDAASSDGRFNEGGDGLLWTLPLIERGMLEFDGDLVMPVETLTLLLDPCRRG